MSALSFARQAFGREKPHIYLRCYKSSITDWVDILTSSNIEEEAYDGIPELVDSINLQAAGPAEASRALRKKLKHGNPHQQYRALVLLKALVENCGAKFQTTFADGQLTDTLKHVAGDSNTDKRVRKKLLLVLASWRDQFKSDPSMSFITGLYNQCHKAGRRPIYQDVSHLVGVPIEDTQRAEKEEAKKRAKREKEEAKERARKSNERRQRERSGEGHLNRGPFVFERDKHKVLASIVEASQASSNLVNAITLVNLETDSLQTNERVQECLDKAQQARKPIVRYIQLVENEELIGTLIETNERIVSAIEMYDKLLAQNLDSTPDISSGITAGLVNSHISPTESEARKLQERQWATVESVDQEHDTNLHPDLQDLSFGPLGASSNNLPAPLRPSTRSDDRHKYTHDTRGSLSDFSDYNSSDEERHTATASSGKRGGRDYVEVSDDPDDDDVVAGTRSAKVPLVQAHDDDPFADPFADDVAIGPSRKW